MAGASIAHDQQWRVMLSGGGVRATLASAGLLWWMRRHNPGWRVSELDAVSGSALTAAAVLAADIPQRAVDAGPDGDAEMDHLVRRLVKVVQFGPWNLCLLIALAGSLVLAPLSKLSPATVTAWWTWIATALAVWLLCLLVIDVVFVPVAVAAISLLIIEFDVSAAWEARLGSIVVVAATAFYATFHARVGDRLRLPRWRGYRLKATGAAVGTAVVIVLLLLSPRWQQMAWIRRTAFLIVGTGAVVTLVGPMFARRNVARIVGATSWSRRRFRDVRPTATSWCRSVTMVATDLRSESAAMFKVGSDCPGTLSLVGPPSATFHSGAVVPLQPDDPACRVPAHDVLLVTAASASAATIPRFAPVMPLRIGTRRPRPDTPLDQIECHPGDGTMPRVEPDDPGPPAWTWLGRYGWLGWLIGLGAAWLTGWNTFVVTLGGLGLLGLTCWTVAHMICAPVDQPLHAAATRAPRAFLLADGGIRGTLGIQTGLHDLTPVSLLPIIVLDATRRRRRSRLWLGLLVPKFGQDLMTKRVVDTILSSSVGFQTQLLEVERDSGRRTIRYVSMAPLGPPPGGDSDEPGRGGAARWSARFNPVRWWWQARREARSAVRRAPGLRVDPRTASGHGGTLRTAVTQCISQLNAIRMWWPSPWNTRGALAAGAGGIALNLAPEGQEDTTDSEAHDHFERDLQALSRVVDGTSWRQRFSECCRRNRPPSRHLVARRMGQVLLVLPLIAALLLTAWSPATACQPVCKDREGGRHPFFGTTNDFIAVAHALRMGKTEKVDIASFERAKNLGFTYMETDIGIADRTELVAVHKKTVRTTSDGDPKVAKLLALDSNVKWNFEINDDNPDLLIALKKLLNQPGMRARVCISFGKSTSGDVRNARAFLGAGMCMCASWLERMRTADFRPVRWAFQHFEDERNLANNVACAVVSDLSADGRDAQKVGAGVVALSWPLELPSNDSEAHLRSLVCAGFGGVMTDHPELLRKVLEDLDMWNNGKPTTDRSACLDPPPRKQKKG